MWDINVEAIVSASSQQGSSEIPPLWLHLRMQYHDCFVNGYGASIPVDGSNSEKTATPNLSIRGFDIIDDAKTAVEKACPGVVSCDDLIVIATRDAVFLSLEGRYEVQTGRRDGLVSQAQNVTRLLPPPYSNILCLNII